MIDAWFARSTHIDYLAVYIVYANSNHLGETALVRLYYSLNMS